MDKIRLRALTKADMEKTLQWHNDDYIKKMYLGHPFPVTRELEEEWYDKVLRSNIPVTVFGIEVIEGKKLIGLSILREINLLNRCAEYAIYIGDAHARGNGYSREATIKTLRFGFKDLGLHRVSLKVLSDNKNAIGLYKKCGFSEEGVLKEAHYKEGRFKDEVVMSILDAQFSEKRDD